MIPSAHDDEQRWKAANGARDRRVGERAVARAQEHLVSPTEPILEKQRAIRYPELAEAALQGVAVGSSAAGEQPKFTDNRVADHSRIPDRGLLEGGCVESAA